MEEILALGFGHDLHHVLLDVLLGFPL